MMDVECWMVDSFRIQDCSFKISQPVRSLRFQEIMGCFNFGFWILDWGEKPNGECWMLDWGWWVLGSFKIQHLKFKIPSWGQGFPGVRQD